MGRVVTSGGKTQQRAVSDAEDEGCMRRLAAGEVRALAPLYERHRGMVMTILRQTLRTHSDAEDLCHDVFLALKAMAPRFRAGGSVRSLLVGIAARKAKKQGAVAWVRRTLLEQNTPAAEPRSEPQRRVEAGRDAEKMLQSLPEDWRTVVLLNLVEGWTAEEIAEALGISPNTVFTRLHRARERIREQWPDDGGTP